ncbi:MAG: L,D-transpeptidase family protein [Geobacteraceae bacterium]|nr:L,D-transpeptidase family protein [Geobacteraceae bacterium]
MRSGILLAILVSIVTVSICSAESQGKRDEASAAVEKLCKSEPPAALSEEFRSIEETFARAEELSREKKTAEAQKLYELTILKSAVYEKKLPETHEAGSSAAGVIQGPFGNISTSGSDQAASPPEKSTGLDSQQDIEDEDSHIDGHRADVPATSPVVSKSIIGREFTYTVRRRESLRMVGAKLGVSWRSIARENSLDPAKPLEPGQRLKIDTRRIIPKTRTEGIVINIPDRTMYLFKGKKLEKAVPVAVGMPTSRKDEIWRTPTGAFRITSKVKDPTWFIPQSILKKMKKNRKDVQNSVPPGKRNPLGRYALKTSLTGILIHGTVSPESIYTYSSHGCIRVMSGNMKEIFEDIRVNTGGEIIYQPVKLALSDDGRVFLEVHGDAYDQFRDLEEVARSLIEKNKMERRVDWERVKSSVKNKKGVPVDVSHRAGGE